MTSETPTARLAGVNRRASTRHDVEIAAHLTIDGPPTECALRNVSQGGAFATVIGLGIGTAVTVRFEIPPVREIVEVTAIVRWTTSEGVGLQFGGLRAREAWALGRYLEALKYAPPGR
jgi:hypothetical protein